MALDKRCPRCGLWMYKVVQLPDGELVCEDPFDSEYRDENSEFGRAWDTPGTDRWYGFYCSSCECKQKMVLNLRNNQIELSLTVEESDLLAQALIALYYHKLSPIAQKELGRFVGDERIWDIVEKVFGRRRKYGLANRPNG